MRTLALQAVTPNVFAPFGIVVTSRERSGRRINAGTSLRVDLPEPDLLADGGRPSLSVFRASAVALPFVVRELERHRFGSQTFVPLGRTPFAVVVALGDTAPDEDTMRAFLVDGCSGVTLSKAVWHHPLLALENGEFVVLERRGAEPDCEVAPVAPARIEQRIEGAAP